MTITSPIYPHTSHSSCLGSSSDDHCNHNVDQSVNKRALKLLIVICCVCLVFMIIEFVGGLFSSSLALISDAAHLMTDFSGFLISLAAISMASLKPTSWFSFGWYRAEVIGALCSILIIWLMTGILMYLATLRIHHMDFEINGEIMFYTSILAMCVNIIMASILHFPGLDRSAKARLKAFAYRRSVQYSTTDNFSPPANPELLPVTKNINIRAAFIHILGDFIQSVGVFVAACIIYFKPEYKIVDPLCTYVFSVLVLFTTFRILADILNVLMEGTPRDVNYKEVLQTLLSVHGVVTVHNLRIWALSLDKKAITAHVAIDRNANPELVLAMASKELRLKFNFFEMTLQVERYLPAMEHCTRCVNPF